MDDWENAIYRNPDGERIGKLMRRFVYTAGVTGVMQVATLIIMTNIRIVL